MLTEQNIKDLEELPAKVECKPCTCKKCKCDDQGPYCPHCEGWSATEMKDNCKLHSTKGNVKMSEVTHCVTLDHGDPCLPTTVPIAAGTMQQCQQMAELMKTMQGVAFRNPGNGEACYLVASPDCFISFDIRALGSAEDPYIIEI